MSYLFGEVLLADSCPLYCLVEGVVVLVHRVQYLFHDYLNFFELHY
jgi:hypothetical protein